MMTEATGLPIKLTRFIAHHLGIDTFIETGTGLGRTSNIASDIFRRVYTIEAYRGRYEDAAEHFRGSNVTCIYGQSPAALATLLDSLDHRQCIIFLDTHCAYRAPITHDACPLLAEIRVAIDSNPGHVILVDDQHFFSSFPVKREHWGSYPELIDVVNALNDARDPFIFIEGKCILCVPRAIKNDIGDFLRGDDA